MDKQPKSETGGITLTGKIKLDGSGRKWGDAGESFVFGASPSRGGPPFDADDFVLTDDPFSGEFVVSIPIAQTKTPPA